MVSATEWGAPTTHRRSGPGRGEAGVKPGDADSSCLAMFWTGNSSCARLGSLSSAGDIDCHSI